MVNKIEYTMPPMVISPVRNAIIEKDVMSDPPTEFTKDTVFLENRIEIKTQKIYDKGLFIDCYV